MSFRIFMAVYFFVLAIELFANLTGNAPLQYFSKPLLMPILLVYYAFGTRRRSPNLKCPVIFALAFSWLGDVLLLVDKRTESLFLYGLVAFLVAHLFYIFYFLRIRRANKPSQNPPALVFFGVAIYTSALFAILAPYIGSLMIPVAVYALVISAMLAASAAAFDFEKQPFGKISVAGTLLFVVSDSILAVNRFAAPFEYAPVFVMLTYGAAQFLITEGSARNLRELQN